MITNKRYKEDMLLLIKALNDMVPLLPIGYKRRLFEPLLELKIRIGNIPDEEPVPKTGFDPNNRIAKHLSPRELEAFEREMEEDDNFTTPVISHPADPDKDEYFNT